MSAIPMMSNAHHARRVRLQLQTGGGAGPAPDGALHRVQSAHHMHKEHSHKELAHLHQQHEGRPGGNAPHRPRSPTRREHSPARNHEQGKNNNQPLFHYRNGFNLAESLEKIFGTVGPQMGH